MIMKKLKLKTPVLLLDEEKCRRNISFMTEKAKKHNLILRPHFKTHQSMIIGEWFRDQGTTKITVSSVTMAWYFAKKGWKDICIAFPFNLHEMNEASELAKKVNLHLTVSSAETSRFIEKYIDSEAGIYIKTDTGYRRTGVPFDNITEIDKILETTTKSKKLHFTGFLVHNGHTYQAPSPGEITRIHEDSNRRLMRLKERYKEMAGVTGGAGTGGGEPILSTGDTPSCSISENFSGIDEIRPGNYVFYDLAQHHLGSCKTSQIAIALAVPVVATHAERNELVVYGGAVHLSKEHLVLDTGLQVWGQVVRIHPDGGWSDPVPDAYVTKVSQEHGILKCDNEFFGQIRIGDFLGILPVHSCLTADLMKGYTTVDGEKVDHLSAISPE